MVTQYPHIIQSVGDDLTTLPFQDAQGDWVIPPPRQLIGVNQQGRAEANGQAVKVPGQNGEKVDYSFMIYMPVDAIEIPYQADVTITDDAGKFIGKGTVKRFYRGSLNALMCV